jgi:hypothetical protein
MHRLIEENIFRHKYPVIQDTQDKIFYGI